jgi:hypothetical protein
VQFETWEQDEGSGVQLELINTFTSIIPQVKTSFRDSCTNPPHTHTTSTHYSHYQALVAGTENLIVSLRLAPLVLVPKLARMAEKNNSCTDITQRQATANALLDALRAFHGTNILFIPPLSLCCACVCVCVFACACAHVHGVTVCVPSLVGTCLARGDARRTRARPELPPKRL